MGATERLIARTSRVTRYRPLAPRSGQFDTSTNLLTWAPPSRGVKAITHYRIRINDDTAAPIYQVPVGQTSLQLTQGVTRVFLSSYNQINDLESPLQLVDSIDPSGGGGVTPPPTPTVTARVIPSSYSADPVTRAPLALVGFTPGFVAGDLPQAVGYYISDKDGGATWVFVGAQIAYGVGVELRFKWLAPNTAATWQVAIVVGDGAGDPNTYIPTAQLPVGAGFSAPFAAAGLGLPANNLVGAITTDAGSGSSWPFNKTTPDGTQYFSITGISYNDATAATDPTAYMVWITAQDLDSLGRAIGPEHQFAAKRIESGGGAQTLADPIDGDYGTNGFTFNRTYPYPGGFPTNIASLRLRAYVGTIKNLALGAWADVTAAVFQVGSTKDVLVATAGALPPGALNWGRAPNIDVGGGGSAQTIQQVRDAVGNVIAWFGKKTVSGVDYYGIWGKNIWVGGTDPTNPKIWLDGTGNAHFIGKIEGGSLSITTYDGTVVTIDGIQHGIYLARSSDFAQYTVDSVFIHNASGTASFSPSAINQNNKFVTDANGKIATLGGLTTAAFGAPVVVATWTADSNFLSGHLPFAISTPGVYRLSFTLFRQYYTIAGQNSDLYVWVDVANGGLSAMPVIYGYSGAFTTPGVVGMALPWRARDNAILNFTATFYTDGTTASGYTNSDGAIPAMFTGVRVALSVSNSFWSSLSGIWATFGFRGVLERLM